MLSGSNGSLGHDERKGRQLEVLLLREVLAYRLAELSTSACQLFQDGRVIARRSGGDQGQACISEYVSSGSFIYTSLTLKVSPPWKTSKTCRRSKR